MNTQLSPQMIEELMKTMKEESVRGARIMTAVELPKDEKVAIESVLSNKFGKQISMTYVVDETLIGGLRIEVGSWVFDASVRHELGQLVKSLKS